MSGFLAASLAEELGLEGVPAGAFTTVASSVGVQLIRNAKAIAAGIPGADLMNGFATTQFKDILGAQLGGYFGSVVGQEIVTPRSEEAALFASATAAVLSAVMSGIPVVGTFLGSAIGQTIGGLIGNAVFDNDDAATYRLQVDPATGNLIAVFDSRVDEGKLELALGMANLAAKQLNTFISQLGGHIDVEGAFSGAILGYFVDHNNNKAAYATGLGVSLSLAGGVAAQQAAISQAVAAGASHALKSLDVVFKDPLLSRAYYASRDEGMARLGLDLQVAKDYRKYLDNAAAINAVIADAPKSAFAAGWALTIARAEELGLDRGSAYDVRGGFYVNLKQHEAVQGPHGAAGGFAAERLAWIPELEAGDVAAGRMTSGSLILRSEDGTARVEVANAFGPGALTSIAGADTNATLNQRAAKGSVVFIKAGNGDKTVYGSAERGSIIVGGAGEQILIGGDGNDWLRAVGPSTVQGMGGDDLLVAGRTKSLLVGGEGRNTYYLGSSNADVRISVLDAGEADRIISPLVGARDQYNRIEVTARSGDVTVKSNYSYFERSGADLIITARAVQGTSFTASGKKTILVENFFLTDSGIDRIEFSDGTALSNAQIWNRAGIELRVDSSVWNADENTKSRSLIDTDDTAGTWFARQITVTGAGETAFSSTINDDGTMATAAYDPFDRHDWKSWVSSYARTGDISLETVTLDNGQVVSGRGGIVSGGIGDDILRGRDTAGLLIGDRGDDRLTSGEAVDRMYGGRGGDVYVVNDPGDLVYEFAGEGDDTVLTSVSYALAPGEAVETLQFGNPDGQADLDLTGNGLDNTLIGNAGDNILSGLSGDDVLHGYGGDDQLMGSLGDDRLVGGGGDDRYSVDSAGDVVSEAVGTGDDLVSTSVSYALAASAEIEVLRISATQPTADLNLTGNGYANTLIGNDGDNRLNGGWSVDILTGGLGRDTFVFNATPGVDSADHVTDFAHGADRIELRASVFDLAVGALQAALFKDLSTGAIDASDRILYVRDTGALLYDADGSGAEAALRFAVIDDKGPLSYADFFVA